MATIETQNILKLWGDKIEIEEVMDMQTYQDGLLIISKC